MSELITPEEARGRLADHSRYGIPALTERRALETIAAMYVETDYRMADPDTTGGKYETRRYQRYVSEWEEVPR